MKVKVKDSIHISSVRSTNIRGGEVVDVGPSVGRQLVDRGLATMVREKKKAPAPANKKAADPNNK